MEFDKKSSKSKWTFCMAKDDMALSPSMLSLDDLYKRSLNDRENKRKMYERALNAALENICSWERMARADGFSVIALTDVHNGSPHPVFEGNVVRFIQAYGVKVGDEKEVGNDRLRQ